MESAGYQAQIKHSMLLFASLFDRSTQKRQTVALWPPRAINLLLFSTWNKACSLSTYSSQERAFIVRRCKQHSQFVLVLTFLMEPRGKLLSLLKVWAWKHLQDLFNATPPRSRQDLSQSDAERGVATVHIRDVVGVLRESK